MKIQWSTAALLIAVLFLLAAAYLFGPALGVPEESHVALVTGLAALCASALAIVGPVVVRVLAKDTDGDGIPDAWDRKTPVDEVTP